jgi:transcription elongation factor Elf1
MRYLTWNKYKESINRRLINDTQIVTLLDEIVNDLRDKDKQSAVIDKSQKLKMMWECPVCYDMIRVGTLEIPYCGHFFCSSCMDTVIQQSRHLGKVSCPICKDPLEKD